MAEQGVKGEPDVVIVGGGAIGVASAHYLAQRGAHVVVLEAGPALGAEASYGNAGLVSPSHCIPLATPSLLRRIPRFMRPGGAVYVKPRLSPALARFGLRARAQLRPAADAAAACAPCATSVAAAATSWRISAAAASSWATTTPA